MIEPRNRQRGVSRVAAGGRGRARLLSFLACVLLGGAALRVSAGGGAAGLDLAHALNQAFADAVEKLSPSVVVITVVQKAAPNPSEDDGTGGLGESLPPEFWRYFHQPAEGIGSGIIIRPDGYILTNGHVVEDADSIQVKLKDGRTFKAKLQGNDKLSDVAVIKIEAKGLPVATFADSARTRVGEFAIAIGTPWSLDYSVSIGHVSAKGRTSVVPGFEGMLMDQDYMQTDAMINPGNSGGPLANIDGQVIGMNTLIHGMHTGLGFAIPSNQAQEVAGRLIAEGKYARAWLGATIRSVREEKESGESSPGISDGVIIKGIMPDGPAAKSLLATNDIVTAVDGKAVATTQELRGEIRHKAVGKAVTLKVFRPQPAGGGQNLQIKVVLTEWVQPSMALATVGPALRPPSDSTGLGLTIHALTRRLASRFSVTVQTNGVIVVGVEPGSVAAEKGLQPGDVITSINQEAVSNPAQFQEAVEKADLKKGVAVVYLRGTDLRKETLLEGKE